MAMADDLTRMTYREAPKRAGQLQQLQPWSRHVLKCMLTPPSVFKHWGAWFLAISFLVLKTVPHRTFDEQHAACRSWAFAEGRRARGSAEKTSGVQY